MRERTISVDLEMTANEILTNPTCTYIVHIACSNPFVYVGELKTGLNRQEQTHLARTLVVSFPVLDGFPVRPPLRSRLLPPKPLKAVLRHLRHLARQNNGILVRRELDAVDLAQPVEKALAEAHEHGERREYFTCDGRVASPQGSWDAWNRIRSQRSAEP